MEKAMRLTHNHIESGVLEVSKSDHLSWVAFASDLRMPVGQVPRLIETNLGNKMDFVLDSANDDVFVYRQSAGCCRLFIYND